MAVVFALTVVMLNTFVLAVAVESDTVVAVILSGVLTVEAVPAKSCRSFVLSQRQGYKNYCHRHGTNLTLVSFTSTVQQAIGIHKTREYKASCTLPVGYPHHLQT